MYDEVDNFGGTGLDWIRLVFELWHLDAVLGLNIWVVGWVYQSMNGVLCVVVFGKSGFILSACGPVKVGTS